MSNFDSNARENFKNINENIVEGHAYDWEIKDRYGDKGQIEIRAWCLNRESEPFLLRIQNFPALCYIELPQHVNRRCKVWRASDVASLMGYIKYVLKDQAPTSHSLTYMPKLYYYRASANHSGSYDPKRYPMLMVTFRNINDMWNCKRFLEQPRDIRDIGQCVFQVWEPDINCVRKMLTIIDLKYTQWFRINARPIHDDFRISTAEDGNVNKEYMVNYQDIQLLTAEETKGWQTYPRVLAYDIESYSSNHNAFPTAHFALDVAYIITIVFQIAGKPETRERYAIVYGNTKPSKRCKTIQVKSEMEGIEKFKEIIVAKNPEIITGYNILGFDNFYLDARIKRRLREWGCLGRIPCEKSDVVTSGWSSKGYGKRELSYLKMAGRINFDLYQLISREFKFNTYTLDTVAAHFLGRYKYDMPAREMFRIRKMNVEALKYYNEELSLKYLGDALNTVDDFDMWMAANLVVHSKMNYKMLTSIQESKIIPNIDDYCDNGEIVKFRQAGKLPDGTLRIEYQDMWDNYCKLLQEDCEIKSGYDVYHPNFEGALLMAEILMEPKIVMTIRNSQQTLYPPHFTGSENMVKLTKYALDIHTNKVRPDYKVLWLKFCQNIKDIPDNTFEDDIAELYQAWKGAALYYEAINEMYRVVEYGIEDAELVMDLFDKLSSWTVLIETASVCGVNPSDLYTRGMQVRGTSLVYDMCVKQGIVMDRRVKDKVEAAGGFVYPPVPGIYRKVICFDFASLYPTIIMAYNICWTTLVPPELMDVIPDHMCHIIEWTETGEFNEVKGDSDEDEDEDGEVGIRPGHYRFKFVKKEVREGILPVLEHNLVAERCRVRALIEDTNDPTLKIILDKRQQALKVCCNSMYGLLGAQVSGKLSLVEGAMSITAIGRESILKANRYLQQHHGAEVVYNDTDSTMVSIPSWKTGLECVEKGPALEKELTALYPEPMKFELEKIMDIICFKKKKYAAFLYAMWDIYKEVKNDDGEVIDKRLVWKKGEPITDMNDMFVRGIILARRDNCKWQRHIYREVLWRSLMGRPLQESVDLIIDHIMKLLTRQVPLTDLVLTRGMGDNYKSDSYFMKVFADELRAIGKPAKAGDRLEYVVVRPRGWNGTDKLLLGKKMRLIETYLDRLRSDDPEPIDVEYYIERALMNPMQQVVGVGYKNELAQLASKRDPTMKKKRGKLYTHIDEKLIKTFLDTLRERQRYINTIKSLIPLNEYSQRYPVQLEIVLNVTP